MQAKDTNRPASSGPALLCLAIALLAGLAASAGLGLRGGIFEPVTSVRGEHYEMATTGVYAYNAKRLVAEGVGWDLVTLAFVVPALLAVVRPVSNGSLRGRLFALGLLGYLSYQYLLYAVTWAFGPLFPLFVLIYALCLVAAGLLLSTFRLAELPARFSADFPHRGVALLCFLLAALLLLLWAQRIYTALSAGGEGILLGQTTLTVQALDLGLFVPLALFTGLMAWRRRPLGLLLSALLVVKIFAMATAICAMLLAAWYFEGNFAPAPLTIFAATALASAGLGRRIHRSLVPGAGSVRV